MNQKRLTALYAVGRSDLISIPMLLAHHGGFSQQYAQHPSSSADRRIHSRASR